MSMRRRKWRGQELLGLKKLIIKFGGNEGVNYMEVQETVFCRAEYQNPGCLG